jgi:hypothetical protein
MKHVIVKETNGLGEVTYVVQRHANDGYRGGATFYSLLTTQTLQEAKDFVDRQSITREVVYET